MDKGPKKLASLDEAIGQRIRAARIGRGMSQQKLAELVGVSFQQVQKYEKGKNRVGGSRMQEIAAALKTTVAFLHGEFLASEVEPIVSDRTTSRVVQIMAELTPAQRAVVLATARALIRSDDQPDQAATPDV